MQFKKVIKHAEWEETLCMIQVCIHSPQIAIDFSRGEPWIASKMTEIKYLSPQTALRFWR